MVGERTDILGELLLLGPTRSRAARCRIANRLEVELFVLANTVANETIERRLGEPVLVERPADSRF